MATTMKQDIAAAVLAQNALAELPTEVAAADWGAVEELTSTDLIVPKIYHQQAMSKLVSEGKARPGDFCDSLTGEVIAKKEEPLQVIVFGLYKTMIIKKQNRQSMKFELDQIVSINATNALQYANKPFQEEINGDTYSNSLMYNFYTLIPGKVSGLPYVLTLGSTKTKAAKKLGTMLTKLSQAKRPGASVVFELTSIAEKNDNGSWFGVEVSQGRDSTAEELKAAHAWYVKSKTQKIVAVEEDEEPRQRSGNAIPDSQDDDINF